MKSEMIRTETHSRESVIRKILIGRLRNQKEKRVSKHIENDTWKNETIFDGKDVDFDDGTHVLLGSIAFDQMFFFGVLLLFTTQDCHIVD